MRLFRQSHFFVFTMAVVTNILKNNCYKGGIVMPDYKQMYLNLLDGVEKTLILLIEAQKSCEEIYIDSDKTVE